MNNILPRKGNFELNISHQFKRGELSKDLHLDIIGFISKPSENMDSSEEHFANAEGMKLGSLFSENYLLDSDVMEFPIFDRSYGSDEPLWVLWTSQSWEEPDQLLFDKSNIKLIINTDHAYYSKFQNANQGKELLIQILAAAYLLIVRKVFEDCQDEDLINFSSRNDEWQEGSICDVLYDFANKDKAISLNYKASDQVLMRDLLTVIGNMVE